MHRKRKLVGLTAVGISVFGLATAYWRRSQTTPRPQGVSVQASRASTPTAPRPKPSRYQQEQIEQVKKHEE